MSADFVGNSTFLKSNGYWESCYYAIPGLSPEEIHRRLVLCGVWFELDSNPALNLEAALELALARDIFASRCLKRHTETDRYTGKIINAHWVICAVAYGGSYDILAFGNSIPEVICLYILRYPEIDLQNHKLPYEGWATRYSE